MKKIMFNDRFGLTAAVLDGSKTMTRRIIPLTAADEEYLDQAFDWDLRESLILDRYAKYKVGEVVAVAQSYLEAYEELLADEDWDNHRDKWDVFRHFLFNGEDHTVLKGWKNKMFVKSEVMPNRIRFTGRKIERLQSITEEDCLKEGVKKDTNLGWYYMPNLYIHRKTNTGDPTLFENPKAAYLKLCQKLRMVLDYSANPWVIAYTFEHVKGGEK